MSGRTRALLGGALFALAVMPSTASAADQTVTATSSPTDRFVPDSVTVTVGERVTWNNAGGLHNVHFDDNSFVEPQTPSFPPWTVTRTFTTTGSFGYYCEAHQPGMSGTVNVSAAPPGTSPPGTVPPPAPAPPRPVQTDAVAPRLALAARRSQRVLRQRGLILSAESDEPATLRASGRVNVPGASRTLRFRSVRVRLAARVERRVRLRLSRKALGSVRRALRRGSRLVARVTISAEDGSRNVSRTQRRIRLRP